MVIIIDNYDSFTYNIVHLVGEVCNDFKVIRNDQYTVEEILKMQASHIILSPGPGYPDHAGICEALVEQGKEVIPILGICLGHQAICEVFGAKIGKASQLYHGKSTKIHIANGSQLFHGLPPMIDGARYHSLVAMKETLSDDLLVIAEDSQGEIMGVKHRLYQIYGLQFHPESILTNGVNCGIDSIGGRIVKNFLAIGGENHD